MKINKRCRKFKQFPASFGRGDGICAFSGAPRSDVINVVLCRQVFRNSSFVRQSVLLPQNGSLPRSPSQAVESKTAVTPLVIRLFWSRRRDSNPRPLRPERNALPAALRLDFYIFLRFLKRLHGVLPIALATLLLPSRESIVVSSPCPSC